MAKKKDITFSVRSLDNIGKKKLDEIASRVLKSRRGASAMKSMVKSVMKSALKSTLKSVRKSPLKVARPK